jgi:hypothetical protein
MRWAGHILYMGEMKNVYKVVIDTPERENYLEDLGVDGRIILERILEK